jgi:hypothetical protein
VELYNDKKSRGLEIVSVNVRDSGGEVMQFMQEFGATHTAALNRTRADVARLYGVRGTPTNVIIDKSGNIVETIVGANMTRIHRALSRAGI